MPDRIIRRFRTGPLIVAIVALIGSIGFLFAPGVSDASTLYKVLGVWSYAWNAVLLCGAILSLVGFRRGDDRLDGAGACFLGGGFVMMAYAAVYVSGWKAWTFAWCALALGLAAFGRAAVIGRGVRR